jgi:hypothetical protein
MKRFVAQVIVQAKPSAGVNTGQKEKAGKGG